MKKRDAIIEITGSVIIGVIAVSLVATVWESVAMMGGHGVVRFVVASILVGGMVFVFGQKPARKS